MATKLYDPDKIVVTWGPARISGFADGSFVKVERNEDAFKLNVGADGETARTRSSNKSGTITITLMQTSSANDMFSSQANLDEETALGSYPLVVKDALGATLCMAPNAWVKKTAAVEYGKEHGNREWVLEADFIKMFVGGTADTGLSSLFDRLF